MREKANQKNGICLCRTFHLEFMRAARLRRTRFTTRCIKIDNAKFLGCRIARTRSGQGQAGPYPSHEYRDQVLRVQVHPSGHEAGTECTHFE